LNEVLRPELRAQKEQNKKDAVTYALKYCTKHNKSIYEALQDKIVLEVLKEVYFVDLSENDFD
jgi:hypothetical protein